MRALICRQYGTPDTLTVETVEVPPLKPGHVRVGVRTAGVSFAAILGIA